MGKTLGSILAIGAAIAVNVIPGVGQALSAAIGSTLATAVESYAYDQYGRMTQMKDVVTPTGGASVEKSKFDYTYKCLASIAKFLPACPIEIIVVDDCSRDETLFGSLLVSGSVRFIRNSKNLGFVGSCNAGAAAAADDEGLAAVDPLIHAGEGEQEQEQEHQQRARAGEDQADVAHVREGTAMAQAWGSKPTSQP